MSNKRRQRLPRGIKQAQRPSPKLLTASPDGEQRQAVDVNPYWQLIPGADRHELGLVANSLADIADSTSRLDLLARQGNVNLSTFQRESRRISVQVRKLLLNQSQGGMCIYNTSVIGLGFSQKSFGL